MLGKLFGRKKGPKVGFIARVKQAFSLDRLMGLGLLVVFLGIFVTEPYPLEFLRIKTFDFFQKQKPRTIPEPRFKPVTIIDLDEKSLNEIGQWPWPRTTVARMVNNLMKMGAVLVAFDIVFAEPDRLNPTGLAKSIPGLDKETREKLSRLQSNDAVFGRILKRSRVVLGQSAFWEDREIKAEPPKHKSVAIRSQKGVDAKKFLPHIPDIIRNIPVIEKNGKGHGMFTLIPEPDGIVRRVPTLFVYKDKFFPALTVEMLRVAFQRPTILVEADVAGISRIKIANKRMFPPKGLTLETDSKGRVWHIFRKVTRRNMFPPATCWPEPPTPI